MEKKDIPLIGVIGVIMFLSGLGANELMSEDTINLSEYNKTQLDNMYVCDANNETGIFYGNLSLTNLSAYPYKENKTDYVRCYSINGTKGKWFSLYDYYPDIELELNKTYIDVNINSTLPVNEDPVDESELFSDVIIKELDSEKIVIEQNNEPKTFYVEQQIIEDIKEGEQEEPQYITIYEPSNGLTYTCEVGGYCVMREN